MRIAKLMTAFMLAAASLISAVAGAEMKVKVECQIALRQAHRYPRQSGR
jgi:hypothetical protein